MGSSRTHLCKLPLKHGTCLAPSLRVRRVRSPDSRVATPLARPPRISRCVTRHDPQASTSRHSARRIGSQSTSKFAAFAVRCGDRYAHHTGNIATRDGHRVQGTVVTRKCPPCKRSTFIAASAKMVHGRRRACARPFARAWGHQLPPSLSARVGRRRRPSPERKRIHGVCGVWCESGAVWAAGEIRVGARPLRAGSAKGMCHPPSKECVVCLCGRGVVNVGAQ